MKNTLKRIAALALALVLVMALAASAYADGTDSTTEPAEWTHDGSHFVSGQTVSETDSVKGLLAASGYDVSLAGASQYTAGAGYNVRASGDTLYDAFLAGYNVTVDGTIARDLYAAANTVTVSGIVSRSAYLAGNTVIVSGKIGGDLYIDAAKVTLADSADIRGTLRLPEGAEVNAPDALMAKLEWYKSAADAQLHSISEAVQTVSVMSRLGSWFVTLLGLVAVALVLLWLTPLWERVDSDYYGAPFAKYARAFGIGFAVLAGVPVAAIILMITRVGVRLALVLLFVYAAAIAAAPVFLGFVLGALLWRGALKKSAYYLAELPIGLLICRVAAAIPGLGFAVGFVAVPLGLGMLTLMLGKGKKNETQPEALPAADSE